MALVTGVLAVCLLISAVVSLAAPWLGTFGVFQLTVLNAVGDSIIAFSVLTLLASAWALFGVVLQLHQKNMAGTVQLVRLGFLAASVFSFISWLLTVIYLASPQLSAGFYFQIISMVLALVGLGTASSGPAQESVTKGDYGAPPPERLI